MVIYVSGIFRDRLLILIVLHHKVVALVTCRHVLKIQIVVTLYTNFAISRLGKIKIIDILYSFHHLRGVRHVKILIQMLEMFSWRLELAVYWNSELIIRANLILVRVFEHLFIISSIWSLRNLLLLCLIIVKFTSLWHLILWTWIKICSLLISCLMI